MLKKLVTAATFLAFFVIVFGAFVRLSDAGLGCPDWPGCYGKLVVSIEAPNHARAHELNERKAWIEMTHRYLAGTLGLLILAIAGLWWRNRNHFGSPALALCLVALVAFQALLGMWTVTLLLKPAVVTLHLLGGMATLALLVWLMMRISVRARAAPHRHGDARNLGAAALWGLVILIVQIGLGGWVSSNYAGLACPDFPLCDAQWVPEMAIASGFHVVRELGVDAAGEPLSPLALNAIHWLHRLGAFVTFIYLGALAVWLARKNTLRVYAGLLAGLLIIQIGLGAANVLLGLPLALAVLHNAVAALLLMTMVMLNFRVTSKGSKGETAWQQA
ncbi:MAG: COX15/CtaA family protein [Burkholderiales bacterium]|nr:COX15/CtaA family protein [Burkholderiales bacterium]